MRRFFVDPADISENKAIISGPEAHHLKSVLRLKTNDRICLFDGTGMVYQAKISASGKEHVECLLLSRENFEEPFPRLHVRQGLLTGKKMDFIVQKATELGIATFQPFVSEHCTAKVRVDSKTSRWERIILESCKQCGRPVPLSCLPATDFEGIIHDTTPFDRKIIFWEQESRRSIRQLFPDNLPEAKNVCCLIGPEGGFESNEIERAEKAGFIPVTLGKRVLRAETAALSAMAIVQFLLGNLEREE